MVLSRPLGDLEQPTLERCDSSHDGRSSQGTPWSISAKLEAESLALLHVYRELRSQASPIGSSRFCRVQEIEVKFGGRALCGRYAEAKSGSRHLRPSSSAHSSSFGMHTSGPRGGRPNTARSTRASSSASRWRVLAPCAEISNSSGSRPASATA